jgi:hypothetical protein
LLKGFDGLDSLTGDLDLIADSATRTQVLSVIDGFFDRYASTGEIMVRCHGLRGATLTLMQIDAAGFGASMFEIDVSEWCPFGGVRALTYGTLLPLLETTDQGWLGPSELLDEVLRLLFKGTPTSHPQAVKPHLDDLLGTASARLLLEGHIGASRVPAILRALVTPGLIIDRIRARRHMRSCPVSPRLGRSSRLVRQPDDFGHAGHEVYVHC